MVEHYDIVRIFILLGFNYNPPIFYLFSVFLKSI